MPSTDRIKKLAARIHDAVYKRLIEYKTTVFLCGAGSHQNASVRRALDEHFTTGDKWFRYDVFYPEDLFDELLFGPNHHDLLNLENILAESVDAVVLAVESYGAVAELGAFASNSNLRKKLVVIIDKAYRRDKSFINYGPVRLLHDLKEGVVVYGDFSNIEDMLQDVRSAVSKVRRASPKRPSVRSVVQAHHYVLSAIYLTQPVPRAVLLRLVSHASKGTERNAEALTAGALSMLNKNREIELTPEGYALSSLGLKRFRKAGSRGRTRYLYDRRQMDSMRVGELTKQLRKRRSRFAGQL